MRLMPLDVMMPLTEGLTFSPPASDAAQSDGSFNPYGEVVQIASVVEEITVLGSLQKPKKVWPLRQLPAGALRVLQQCSGACQQDDWDSWPVYVDF